MGAETVAARAAAVRLLTLDVDGVLTDGRLYFSAQGEELKAFHVRDGAGIVQLLEAGIQVAVISGRQSQAVERRMAELGVAWVKQGIKDKLLALQEILDRLRLQPRCVACVGDDSPDLPLMHAAQLACAVADAHASVRQSAHYVTQLPGGRGAVREVCDLLLGARPSAAR